MLASSAWTLASSAQLGAKKTRNKPKKTEIASLRTLTIMRKCMKLSNDGCTCAAAPRGNGTWLSVWGSEQSLRDHRNLYLPRNWTDSLLVYHVYILFRNCFPGCTRNRENMLDPYYYMYSSRFSRMSSVHEKCENGPQKYQKHIRLCRYFTTVPRKLGTVWVETLHFRICSGTFPITSPGFRGNLGPCPKHLSFRIDFHVCLGR